MAVECSSSLTRRVALGAAGAALALLGGCVVVSAEPYEIGAPVVYSGAAYAPYYGSAYYGAPAYYYGAPGYYPYWRPSVSLGIWGGWGGGGMGGGGWGGGSSGGGWSGGGGMSGGGGASGSW